MNAVNHDSDWSKHTITGGNKLASPILMNSNARWSRQFIPVGSGTVSFTPPFRFKMGAEYRYLWRATSKYSSYSNLSKIERYE